MSRLLQSALIVVCSLALAALARGAPPAAAAGRSCLLISFTAGPGVTAEQAADVTAAYRQALSAGQPKLRLLPPETPAAALSFDAAEAAVAALALGRARHAHDVIFGCVERTGVTHALETALVDVAGGRCRRRLRTGQAGAWAAFLAQSPASNAAALLGQAPAATAPPPVSVAAVARANPAPAAPAPRTGHPAGWLHDRLELGTRLNVDRLRDADKESFVGSVDHLDLQQDLLPADFFVAWQFNPYLGLELERDFIEARMLTSSDGHNDGSVVLSGPTVSLTGRWPLARADGSRLPLTPYGALGTALLGGSFRGEGWWENGFGGETPEQLYADYDAWRAAGSPPAPNGGYKRTMGVKGAIGLAATAGCLVPLGRGFSLDLRVRYLRATAKAHYWLVINDDVHRDYGTHEIPLDTVSLGLGVRYAF